MSSINIVDIGILIVFFLSIIIGFSRGLVSEVVSLLTLIAAFIVAITFTTPLANVFTNSSSVQSVVTQTSTSMGVSTAQPISYMALGISFAILFASTVIVGTIVKSVLNLALSTGILGIGNRILGGVFGCIRGFLLNLVIIFLVQLSPLSEQSWWQQSQYVPKFTPAVQWLAAIVSPTLTNLKVKFGTTLEDVNSSISKYTQ